MSHRKGGTYASKILSLSVQVFKDQYSSKKKGPVSGNSKGPNQNKYKTIIVG